MCPHPGLPLLPFSRLLISAPALPSLTPHPAPSSPGLSDPGTMCVCGYPGGSHLVFPSKGRKSTHRGFCTLAQGSGKYGLQRDERCFPDLTACVFLIIPPWEAVAGFCSKATRGWSFSSQDKATSLELVLGRPPVSRTVKTPCSLSLRAQLCSQTPSLPPCWPPPEPPPLPPSPYNLPCWLQQEQAFLEQDSYHLAALSKHLRYLHGKSVSGNGSIKMYHGLFNGLS